MSKVRLHQIDLDQGFNVQIFDYNGELSHKMASIQVDNHYKGELRSCEINISFDGTSLTVEIPGQEDITVNTLQGDEHDELMKQEAEWWHQQDQDAEWISAQEGKQ